MLKIDNSLLQEIGLGTLPDAEKNSLLKHVYETLEMRVGMRLADQMSNQQLDEFEQYFEAKDDAGAFKWLESNFPNYKDIVQEEFNKLKAEVQASAPQILGASQTSQVAQPAAAPQVNPGFPSEPPVQQPQYAAAAQPYAPPQPAFDATPTQLQAAPAPQTPQQPFPSAPAQLAVDPNAGYQPQATPVPAQPFAAPVAPSPVPQPPQPDPSQYQPPVSQPDPGTPTYQPPFPFQQPPAGPQA